MRNLTINLPNQDVRDKQILPIRNNFVMNLIHVNQGIEF